ncbi:MAG: glycine zipper domain-containing protein [Candidatus Marsarchaeota archaeon]|nr:glycine zipper domain-containing protein [Candidatus Marsarchaeota archaeon]
MTKKEEDEWLGLIAGGTVGALIAGPVGAVIGAAIGLIVGAADKNPKKGE